MQFVRHIFLAAAAIAVLQAAAKAALIVFAVLLVWLGVSRPREMAAFIGIMTILGLTALYPVASLTVFGSLAALGWLRRLPL